MTIQFIEQPPGIFRVRGENAKYLGTIYREVDGFYVYDPEKMSGYMSEGFLMEVALKLSDLNADWNDQITKEFRDSQIMELKLVEPDDDPFTNTRTGALF